MFFVPIVAVRLGRSRDVASDCVAILKIKMADGNSPALSEKKQLFTDVEKQISGESAMEVKEYLVRNLYCFLL